MSRGAVPCARQLYRRLLLLKPIGPETFPGCGQTQAGGLHNLFFVSGRWKPFVKCKACGCSSGQEHLTMAHYGYMPAGVPVAHAFMIGTGGMVPTNGQMDGMRAMLMQQQQQMGYQQQAYSQAGVFGGLVVGNEYQPHLHAAVPQAPIPDVSFLYTSSSSFHTHMFETNQLVVMLNILLNLCLCATLVARLKFCCIRARGVRHFIIFPTFVRLCATGACKVVHT